MIPQFWSWLLTIITCTGLLLAGRLNRPRMGWGICLAGQALWLYYAIITEQHGFILGAAVFGMVYLANLRR